ncbi:MAG: metallophosphoesterase, partial [Gaiellaceae bacterium]|nr:metallophosphoesterase [Gaiellaceae bacterium]
MAAGPFPVETLDRIMDLDAIWIRGNADRELLSDEITEGGLISEWVVDQLEDRHRAFIAALPDTLQLDVE